MQFTYTILEAYLHITLTDNACINITAHVSPSQKWLEERARGRKKSTALLLACQKQEWRRLWLLFKTHLLALPTNQRCRLAPRSLVNGEWQKVESLDCGSSVGKRGTRHFPHQNMTGCRKGNDEFESKFKSVTCFVALLPYHPWSI